MPDLWPIKVHAGPTQVEGHQAIAFCVEHVLGAMPPIHGTVHPDVAIALRDALNLALEAQGVEA